MCAFELCNFAKVSIIMKIVFFFQKQVVDKPTLNPLVSIMIASTLQILLPCYFANNLTLSSEKLSSSLFYSNWMKESKKFKIAMKLFMENSKKPLKISAFGVFDINLEKFLCIINLAYSLYVLLKEKNSKF